jgi:glutamate-1-semialdehyde 2,1-aminomutase
VFYKAELNNFLSKRPRSHLLWKKSVNVLPGGISHNIRNLGLPSIDAFPVFIQSAHDAYLVDVDDIKYLDFWNGHYAMILGHRHPAIKRVLQAQIDDGWHFGTVTENQQKLAEKLIGDNRRGIEKVRFCTSGTEATMYATRLARAFTGKRLIAKAKMGWHGANDTLFYDVRYPFTGQESPGILSNEEAVNDLAAIVIEPVLGGGGGFPVDKDFLKMLREITEEKGIILIFDEVITGYRFSYGLYQNQLNIIPDLTTMGKIIGGGMPVGALGGREEIIEQANPELQNRVWIGGGTFSGNPLSMAAGLKTLEILNNSSSEYQRINKMGSTLHRQLNTYFKDEKLNLIATGYKSIVFLHVLFKLVENPSPNDIVAFTDKKREALTHLALLNRNVTSQHGLGVLSFAHSKEQIQTVQKNIEEIAPQISQTSFY